MRVFGLILLVAVVIGADAGRRDKRTFGSIFQFFGFKLVPLTESEIRKVTSEKLQYPEPLIRNGKLMRLRTVMPKVEEIIEATSEMPATTRTTSTEAPLTRTSSTTVSTTTTETPTIAAEPLRIILPDMITMFEDFKQETSKQPAMKTFTQTSTEAATEIPSTVQSSSTQTLPTESTGTVSNEIAQEFTLQNEPNSPFSAAVETFGPTGNIASLPLSLAPTHSFESPPVYQMNNNFEFFRSNDISSSFHSPDAFHSLGLFPQNLMPPRPFALQSSGNAASRFAMNMDGQKFNYQTQHN